MKKYNSQGERWRAEDNHDVLERREPTRLTYAEQFDVYRYMRYAKRFSSNYQAVKEDNELLLGCMTKCLERLEEISAQLDRGEDQRFVEHRNWLERRERVETAIRLWRLEADRVIAIAGGWQSISKAKAFDCPGSFFDCVNSFRWRELGAWQTVEHIIDRIRKLKEVKTVDDLIKLPGIGKKTIEKIKNRSDGDGSGLWPEVPRPDGDGSEPVLEGE